MTPERWQQVTELFHVALEREPAQRAAFLEAACADDEELRREVISLIRSHQDDDGLIDLPVLEKVAEVLADEASELAIGQSIGHYKILKSLGAGGMGQVYLAQDQLLDRKVAIKVLPASLSYDRPLRARFIREAQLASALDHPNICTIHEVGESAGRQFIVMQYVEGDTLKQVIGERPLSLDRLLSISLQVADALAAAHSQGIIHRDIKSSNILITRRGKAKVLDFGLAKLIEDSEGGSRSGLTQTGAILGTPSYMSPEQARGEHVDHRSDIFSFGLVMYEMATGRVAFKGKSQAETMNSVINEPHRPVGDLNKEVPPELSAVIDRALAKEAGDRYQSMEEFITELRLVVLDKQAIQTSPLPSSRPTSSAKYLISAIKRRKRRALLALATLVLAASGSAYIAYLIYQQPKINGRPTQYSLARLTFDPGLQTEPTWSPDARFIAYTSDRSGNFDIWVEQVGGGNPLQITHSPAHDWQPDWSPNGTNLVFRSEREGGGLFVVPALGGLERKVSSFGYSPQWSPDGSKILFSDSATFMANPPVKVASKLYLATLTENEPHEVLLPDFIIGFDGLFSFCWHPDSQRISFYGQHAKLGWGFWTVPIAGGPPVRSEWLPAVQKKLDEGIAYNFQWASSGTEIYFEGIFNGVTNLWKVVVDPATLSWVAGPERLTTGAGIDTEIALSRDGKRLAFCSRIETIRVWSLPFNARTGQIKGEGQPLTAPGIVPTFFDLSPDSKKLVFNAARLGNEKLELWEKSLEDGAERLLTVSDNYVDMCPRWSRDGTRISYRRAVWNPEHTDSKFELVILHPGSNEEQVLPLEADTVVSDWSADGQWLLGFTDYQKRRHFSTCLFPVSATHAEKEMRVVASDPADNLFGQRLSPDDRWISFVAVRTHASVSIYVVPWSGGKKILITDDKYWNDKPRWSPDGKTIYFVAKRGTGFLNVWGIRFEPQEGKPIGEPFQVTSFEDPGKMIWPSGRMTLSVSEDRLLLPIQEVTGSIWMLENVDR